MSDSDDDNIVRYGTQLEPYEEDRTCAMPKTKTKLKDSEKKKLRKLLSANVNVNKAREVCHLSWPQICQIIPGIEHIAPENSLNPPKKTKKKHPKLRVRPLESLSREFEPDQASFWRNPCDARVARRTSQDRVVRRTSQDRVARRTSQDRVARRTSQDRVARRKSQDRVARRTSQERVARRTSQDRVARRTSQDRVARRTSQDRGTSPNYWKVARRNKPSPLRNEYEITNRESFLRQPYRPPQTYTKEVLHTSDLNYWEEAEPSQERAYVTNLQKRPPSEGELHWEPPYKIMKGSHVDCGEPNYWERHRSPPRSRHDATSMDCRSNNSYERTQLNYSDADALQVKVQDGMRAVDRRYNDISDVKPFSDPPYKDQKASSEGGTSLSYWPEPDRPSRLGLRNETHPPKRAHTYSYSEDKKLKVSKYQKSSWESSVNLDYRDSDRPLRDGLRNETQAMTTSCIYDGSDEKYRGRTYKPRSPVEEGRRQFDFSEPDRRQTTSENDSHIHWDLPSENHETFKDNDGNVNKDAGPIPVGIRNVTPMTKKQMTLVHQSINQAIVQIGVQGAGPKFLGSTYKTGWILMNCENHMSRKWLEMKVPSLKPWPEANLSITPQNELPKPITLSILIPDKEGVTVATALELLRVQNPGLEIDNWKVFEVTKTYSGQIVLLSVDEDSFEALRLLNFKANLGINKVGFWVRSGPSKWGGYVNPSAEDVPVASSSAYTERENEVPSKRKYQQAPDQFAVDEHGRRRFHGAFTGGFSAGFGNTVGSQEGWTPSTFKSSRAEKASFSNQRPEDFMDEEDRGEFGIAPRQVQTHHEFSGQKRPHRTQYHDGPIPGQPVLQQLVRAVHETAAVRMLRAMGWKEGQGTGERLSGRGKKNARKQHKVYGCYMPPELKQAQEDQNQNEDEATDSSDSEFDFDTLFAPDDYEPYILHRKNDRFGLGYSGLSRHSVLGNLTSEYGNEAGSSRSHLVMKDKGKRVSIRGQAFGVGAFEKDDEDIYANEDMSHYDFSIGGPAPLSEKKKTQVQKSGHVIQGFIKASKPLPSVPTYPAPALPRDYVPAVAGARRSRFEPTTQQPRDQGLGRHELSAKARGELLGEAPLPILTDPLPPTPTPKNTPTEDPIAKLLGKTVNFVTLTEKTELDYISIKDSGKDLTRVFKPFVGNPEKQKRYERFVENKGVLERDGDVDKLKEWEREREMVEFEQAAKLYRPLSGVMGDRFTHASEPDDGTNPLSAVARSSTNHGLATKAQMEAAQQGVYGVMTRQQTSWRPEAMLCRRFNVPEIGGTRTEPKKEDRPKVSYSVFSYLESSVHDKDSFAKEQSKFSGSKSLTTNNLPKTDQIAQKTDQGNKSDQNINQNAKEIIQVNETAPGFSKRMTVAELFLKESEKTKNQGAEVTDTINKFDKMDLYKSIFLSDSEEEEDKDKSNQNEGKDFIDVPKNVERNTSPPRGIFANIDFDELNSWRRKDEPTKKPEDSSKKVNNVNLPTKHSEESSKKVESLKADEKINEEEAMYGPKIPENLQKRLQSEAGNNVNETIDVGSSSSDEDSWVDVNEVKSKKHKKKKSKKHKSKHKKKSKSKKKDR